MLSEFDASGWLVSVKTLEPLISQQDTKKLVPALQNLIDKADGDEIPTLGDSMMKVLTAVNKNDYVTAVTEYQNLVKFAKRESDSSNPDRIRNEEVIDKNMDALVQSLKDEQTAQGLVLSIKEKILGRNYLDPLFGMQKQIEFDIKSTPLTPEGRRRLNARFATIKIEPINVWKIMRSGTVLFFLAYSLKNVVQGWAVTKVKKKLKLHKEHEQQTPSQRKKRKKR